MLHLKEVLLNEYGSFSDKRIKNIEKGSTFIVDDRTPGDVGGDKQLYLWFCMVFAEVLDANTVSVSLHRNVPTGAPVSAWAKANGVKVDTTTTTFSVTPDTLERLTVLAKAFRSIVAPGAPRYAQASYKYVCPRTAGSLERLAKALAGAWGD